MPGRDPCGVGGRGYQYGLLRHYRATHDVGLAGNHHGQRIARAFQFNGGVGRKGDAGDVELFEVGHLIDRTTGWCGQRSQRRREAGVPIDLVDGRCCVPVILGEYLLRERQNKALVVWRLKLNHANTVLERVGRKGRYLHDVADPEGLHGGKCIHFCETFSFARKQCRFQLQ